MDKILKVNKTTSVKAISNSVTTSINADYVRVSCFSGISCYFKNVYDKFVDDHILMNAFQRKFFDAAIGTNLTVLQMTNSNEIISDISCFIKPVKSYVKIIDNDDAILNIVGQLGNIPITSNLKYAIRYDNETYVIEFNDVELNKFIFLNDSTNIVVLTYPEDLNIKIAGVKQALFKENFSINKMNIGGLTDELGLIFRRGFSTRVLSKKTCDDLDIKHIKGIMLYGAPGCGKTLIAKELGKIVGCDDPTIVAGPELISSYQGLSEENVRNLFTKAYDNPDKLSVIICDECDAIFKKRNSIGSGTANNITNQFLSMIDGPKSLNNVLLICMTNRIDLIDEAIIRPGRIELTIEIGLPNLQDRVDIFNVHTRNIIGQFKEQFDFELFAKLANNFTGAEIESVVQNAKSKAISRVLDIEDINSFNVDEVIIKNDDVIEAISETTSSHGNSCDIFNIVEHNEINGQILDGIYNDIICFNNKHIGTVAVTVIMGETLDTITHACAIVKKLNVACIKHITSEYLMTNSLYEILVQLYRSDTSAIILESIENIVGYNPLNGLCNNETLQVIYSLVNKITDKSKSINVIITTKNKGLCEKMFTGCDILYIDEIN
jgi:ATP-dependent 26S proteasome regulatory subunit